MMLRTLVLLTALVFSRMFLVQKKRPWSICRDNLLGSCMLCCLQNPIRRSL